MLVRASCSGPLTRSLTLYHQIGVNFPWYPLFATPAPPGQQADFSLSGGLPATTAIEIPDLQFERCSVLINMAAAYASNATREDRTQAEGMKKATAGFSVRSVSPASVFLPMTNPAERGRNLETRQGVCAA